MEQTSWWHDRIVGGLASYWVYQHLGNLGPADRAADRLWQRVVDAPRPRRAGHHRRARRAGGPGRPGAGAATAGATARDFDTQARLVVVDSRAARVLRARQPLDPRRGRDGLARREDAGRLRPPPRRHLAAVPAGPRAAPRRGVQRGTGPGRVGQDGRQGRRDGCGRPPTWSTGRRSSRASATWPRSCSRWPRGSAAGPRGRSRSCPATCTTATSPGRARAAARAVRSRARSCRPSARRSATRCRGSCTPSRPGRRASRSAGSRGCCPDSPRCRPRRCSGGSSHGPWYDNNLAILELRNSGLRLWWTAGEVVDRPDRPVLRRVATIDPIG